MITHHGTKHGFVMIRRDSLKVIAMIQGMKFERSYSWLFRTDDEIVESVIELYLKALADAPAIEMGA